MEDFCKFSSRESEAEGLPTVLGEPGIYGKFHNIRSHFKKDLIVFKHRPSKVSSHRVTLRNDNTNRLFNSR